MSKLRDIIEGWQYDLFPPKELKELIIRTQEERLAICKDCPFNSTKGRIGPFSYCKDCGCPLKKKTACLHCECPQKKWAAVITEKEQIELNKKLNQKNEPDNI